MESKEGFDDHLHSRSKSDDSDDEKSGNSSSSSFVIGDGVVGVAESKTEDAGRDNTSSSGRLVSNKKEMDGDFLISELQKYFYEDDELCATFENFVKEKSAIIDLEAEEYSLEYTRVYHEYRDLLENKLEAHIERLGYDPVEFYQCVRDKVDTQPNGSIAFFAQILLGVSEFDVFMTMMREAARNFRSSNRK
jgi:hypothetical protein